MERLALANRRLPWSWAVLILLVITAILAAVAIFRLSDRSDELNRLSTTRATVTCLIANAERGDTITSVADTAAVLVPRRVREDVRQKARTQLAIGLRSRDCSRLSGVTPEILAEAGRQVAQLRETTEPKGGP